MVKLIHKNWVNIINTPMDNMSKNKVNVNERFFFNCTINRVPVLWLKVIIRGERNNNFLCISELVDTTRKILYH